MSEHQWWVLDAVGQQHGPYTQAEYDGYVAEGRIGVGQYVWRSDWPEWRQHTPEAPPTQAGAVSMPPGHGGRAASSWAIPAMPLKRYRPNSFWALYWAMLVPQVLGALGTLVATVWIIVLVVQGEFESSGPDMPPALVWLLVGIGVSILLVFVSLPFYLMLVYRVWRQIQDGHAATGPGKACGFLLIPFFNFYWFFVAFGKLAPSMNEYAERRGVPLPEMGRGLGQTAAISYAVCSGIQLVLSVPAVYVAYLLRLVFLWQAAGYSARLARLDPAEVQDSVNPYCAESG